MPGAANRDLTPSGGGATERWWFTVQDNVQKLLVSDIILLTLHMNADILIVPNSCVFRARFIFLASHVWKLGVPEASQLYVLCLTL